MINAEKNRLIWKNSGETVVIEPWGENALRVRSVMMGDILETDYALLSQKDIECVIESKKDWARITNGKITAEIVLDASGWRKDHGRITFFRKDGTVLFGDIDHEDSPSPHPRRFRPKGGDQSLT